MDVKLVKEDLGGAAVFIRGGGSLEVEKLRLLDRQQELRPGVLYLGTLDQARALAPGWEAREGSALLLAEAPEGQAYTLPQERLPECTVFSRLSLGALFNRVSTLLESAQTDPLHAWKQVLGRRVVDPGEIRERLFGGDEGTYVQLLLLRRGDQGPLPQGLARQAAQWFPGDLVIPDEREIAVLRQHREQLFTFPLPEGMEEGLRVQGCVAGIGNATRDCSMLRTICQMLRHMLRLRQRLGREDVLCQLDQYQMMIVIDYCVQEYVQRNGHQDICYLAHPALVHLARYDLRRGTNLRQVLYQYLLFGGNIQRTAAALYMHRNTVQNKLKKIGEMVSLDLSDGLLCQRLLLSCQLLEYAEKVLHLRVDEDRRESSGNA
ncbi:MAG: PucR family transcriptional regulator [Acutalibacter sp.]|jgi:hypothetical protein